MEYRSSDANGQPLFGAGCMRAFRRSCRRRTQVSNIAPLPHAERVTLTRCDHRQRDQRRVRQYAAPAGHAVIGARPYVPRDWADDRQRLQAAGRAGRRWPVEEDLRLAKTRPGRQPHAPASRTPIRAQATPGRSLTRAATRREPEPPAESHDQRGSCHTPRISRAAGEAQVTLLSPGPVLQG